MGYGHRFIIHLKAAAPTVFAMLFLHKLLITFITLHAMYTNWHATYYMTFNVIKSN